MVRPIGFGPSVPLMAPAGLPAAGTPPPAAAGAAASAGAAAPAPAASTPVSVPQAFQMVQDLWVAKKVTAMDVGRGSLGGTVERFDYWYYPKLGKALTALYKAAGSRTYRNAIKQLEGAATASQLQIAFNAVNAVATLPISGHDIVRVAKKLDQDEALKESIKVCLGNIRSVVDYKLAVDINYYEAAFEKMLTSALRGGASLKAVREARMKALQDIDARVKAGKDPEVAVDEVAGELAKDPRFKLFSPAAPAAGAAASGALTGYPPRAVELAKELVQAKARQEGEALTDDQVADRAAKLLNTSYKGYMGHPPTMIKAMEEDLVVENGKAGGAKFITFKAEGSSYVVGESSSDATIDAQLNLPKIVSLSSQTSVGVLAGVIAGRGQQNSPGLSPDATYVGGLRAMEDAGSLVGSGQLTLNHETEKKHKLTFGGGLLEGAWGVSGSYKTPSLISDDDLTIGVKMSVATKTPGKGGWTGANVLKLEYKQKDGKATPSIFDSAKVHLEFHKKSETITSKVIVAGGLKLWSKATLDAQYRHIVLGDTHQDFKATFGYKLSSFLTIKVEGVWSADEKAVSYGMPNAGASLDGSELSQQPTALNAKSNLMGTATLVLEPVSGVQVFAGAGVLNDRLAVEERSENSPRALLKGGLEMAF